MTSRCNENKEQNCWKNRCCHGDCIQSDSLMAADGACHHLCKLMAQVRHRWSINDVIGGIRNTVMPSDCSPVRFGIRSLSEGLLTDVASVRLPTSSESPSFTAIQKNCVMQNYMMSARYLTSSEIGVIVNEEDEEEKYNEEDEYNEGKSDDDGEIDAIITEDCQLAENSNDDDDDGDLETTVPEVSNISNLNVFK
ncbi:hypothetical protein ANN_27942 [Periplaneta americana]|uniref:Uncharacterized protein n=1 Tax=Periplaneta americana TaxID=6978 RepID=A0ABQ8RVN4_PERAM|nr:hypothetical protein ANN_27942 [Periplaneta americana]